MISEKNKEYAIYFLNLLASGLFYSFLTAKLIEQHFSNTLVVLTISSLVSIMIMVDIRTYRFLERVPLRLFSILSVVVLSILLVLNHISNNILIYIIAYFFMTILFCLLSLAFQTKILKYEINFTVSFLNMQLLRTLAKMIGFFLGIVLSQLHIKDFFFYTCITVVLLNSFLTFSYKKSEFRVLEKIKGKINGYYSYLILGFFSTATILWIPLLTKTFMENDLNRISWIPFILPGVMSTMLIILQKRVSWFFSSLFMEISYVLFFSLFLLIRLFEYKPILQAILFSIVVALDLSLSVKVRKRFLEENSKNNMRYVLQSLGISTTIFLFIFSVFGFESGMVELVLFACCMASVMYMIVERRKFA